MCSRSAFRKRAGSTENILEQPACVLQWIAVIGLVVLAGCATPIGVNRIGLVPAYQQIAANAMTGP